MATAEADILSTRDVADRFGVGQQQVVAVIDRLGLARRIGRNRAVKAEDLDQIKTGLLAAGYLTPDGR